MTLTPEEAKAFYKIVNPLDAYFARHLGMKLASSEDAMKVRESAFARPELLEDFAKENPARLSADDLDTVRSWKHQLSGKFLFQAERKEGCWFQATEEKKVYLVQGIMQPISEIVPFTPQKDIMIRLNSTGVTQGHFAILNSTIIAGHQDKTKAVAAAKSIVPPDLMDGIVWVEFKN